MSRFTMLKSRGVAVVAASAILALAAGTGAVAGAMVTSRDIQDKTIRTADLHKNSIKTQKVKNGTLRLADMDKKAQAAISLGGPQGPTGPQGPKGDTGSATYLGANWSIVDRNINETGDAFLRSGPSVGTTVKPPKGIGSLGLRTGSPNDRVAFGNQVDWAGKALSTVNTVSYYVFTTGENNDLYAENLPSVAFEVNPNLPGRAFSTLVYTPVAAPAEVWSKLDASTAQRWWFSGGTGTDTGCTQTTYCTLAEAKAAAPDSTLLTTQVTKGRDYAFSGAVDALQINNVVYDFEPFGVSETTP
jgi:hypothetical protein